MTNKTLKQELDELADELIKQNQQIEELKKENEKLKKFIENAQK